MFSSQFDQPLFEKPPDMEMTPEARTILDLPKKIMQEPEFFIQHVALTLQEIKQEVNKRGVSNYDFANCTDIILEMKEKKVIGAIVDLYKQIYTSYKKTADALGVELNADNFYQEVFVDLTFRDLMPGDLTFAFDVFTKRRLVKKV